jgi:hypothetical protein
MPTDLSTQIGQVLYEISLTAATSKCNCEVCKLARELAGLLAQQLREGPAWPQR